MAAGVNLPFSKFNKKLIGREKKVISTLTIKGQLTSQFSRGQEKKSGTRREKLNSPMLSPSGSPAPQSQGCCVPLLAQFQPGIIFSALREARIPSALLMTRRSPLRGPLVPCFPLLSLICSKSSHYAGARGSPPSLPKHHLFMSNQKKENGDTAQR